MQIAPDAAGDARVVLIGRTSYDGHHPGVMSLPGGAAEAGDADLVATTLREAGEEIGLDRLPEWVPDPRAVKRVIEAPLAGFLPDAPIQGRARRP